MEFTRVRDVKTPNRGTPGSAGIDFYIPRMGDKFIADMLRLNPNQENYYIELHRRLCLEPAERILIPSGVHVKLPPNIALIAHNKSGIATKKGLTVMANTIDRDYQGEIHISLLNTSHIRQNIYEGEKIVQFIPIHISEVPLVEHSTLEELYTEVSERGAGGFGSTNEKI